jgi:subtilisin family serine protease
MQEFLSKCDPELQIMYLNYLRIVEEGMDGDASIHPDIVDPSRVSVLMLFEGDLSEIEALGAEKIWCDESEFARVYINLAELGDIASHPNVLGLEYGSECELFLDTSVKNIKARGTGNVWNINSDGNFGYNDKTGKGVIIGIIDSGIDFTHPMFYKTVGSEKKTKILRIWDMGLKKEGSESEPDMNLLGKPYSYGVEFTASDINDILQNKWGGEDVRHRDNTSHGTHVASIAAGDGRAINHNDDGYKLIGVAPEAELIVVKFTDLESRPIDPNSTKPAPENRIPDIERIEDAIRYILNVVKNEHEDRPVVINLSSGLFLGPRDGLTVFEAWLDKLFDRSKTVKKAMVVAAGNEGDKYKVYKNHAVITIPTSGSIDVPFYLDSEQKFLTFSYRSGRYEPVDTSLDIDMWYAATGVGVQLKRPEDLEFNPDSPVAPLGSPNKPLGTSKKIDLYHSINNAVRAVSAVSSVKASKYITLYYRYNIRFKFSPDARGRHNAGKYIVKLTGPPGTKIYAWCRQRKKCGIFVHKESDDITITDEHTTGSPGGAKNVITVAAYSDIYGGILNFSSSGPLVDYLGNNPPKPYANKPDIAAPGVKINAAVSPDTKPHGRIWRRLLISLGHNNEYYDYDKYIGTSFAAPHVAGAIALMFEKNPDLTLAKLFEELTDEKNADTASPPRRFGAGKINVKKVIDKI